MRAYRKALMMVVLVLAAATSMAQTGLPALDPSLGRIVIYRPWHYASGAAGSLIALNGDFVGMCRAGKYIYVDAQPGMYYMHEYLHSLGLLKDAAKQTFSVRAGQTAYVRLDVEFSYSIQMVPAERAQSELSSVHYDATGVEEKDRQSEKCMDKARSDFESYRQASGIDFSAAAAPPASPSAPTPSRHDTMTAASPAPSSTFSEGPAARPDPPSAEQPAPSGSMVSGAVGSSSAPSHWGSQSLIGSVAPRGAPQKSMTMRQACSVEKHILPGTYSYPRVQFTNDGIEVGERRKSFTIRYADIDKVEFSPGVYQHADVLIHLSHKHGFYMFSFFITQYSNSRVQELEEAINSLAQDAAQGQTVVCSDNPDDYKVELDDFQARTADWRALATKPPVSDEVYKDRLLAEDALKNRDLGGAVKYYELGIAADPTWDQGWYNAALVYAELNDYFNAALCMRHYVILQPDASDAQAAKDNIILWEAKAQQAPRAAAGEAAK